MYPWSREPTGSIDVRPETDAVVLSYRSRDLAGSEWKSADQRVSVVWKKCTLGGERPWVLCRYCRRRVAKLYLGSDAVFACRRCYGLAYASQRESLRYRGICRARKIRMRLGGGPSLLDPFPPKPRGMHWSTYERLQRRAYAAEGFLYGH